MAAGPITSLAPELLQEILRACDGFSDLIALASSCKTIYSVWKSKAPSLLWGLAPPKILGFNAALMAVRATNIVAEAQSKGIEPPSPFPIQEICGKVKKPLPSEMQAVFDFEHLVKCVEWMMTNWKISHEPEGDFGNDPLLVNQHSRLWVMRGGYEKWKERLHRALYYVLLAGAAFSGPYNAPFFQAERAGRTEFLQRCARCVRSTDGSRGATILVEEDFEYLKTFAVYHLSALDDSDMGRWRDDQYETIFGPLARYLIEDGRDRGFREGLDRAMIAEYDELNGEGDVFSWYTGEQAGSIREIKSLVAAYEHLRRKVYRTDYSKALIFGGLPAIENFEGQRKVTVAVFGQFQLDEISLPVTVEASENGFLWAKPVSESSELSGIDFSQILHQMSMGEREFQPAHPLPPTFQFFSYCLRKFFNLKWKPNIFKSGWGHEKWLDELANGDMFQAPHSNFNMIDSLVLYRSPSSAEES